MGRKRYFSHDEVLPQLIDHVAEAQIFSANQVSISVRTPVRTGISQFMVTYIDPETKEKAFRPFHHIEQALDFAEDVQVVR